MKYRGGERWIRSVLYILISTSLWSLGFFITKAISPGELLISRLQITGGTGKTDNDFVTIYNNSSTVIDLYGFRLVKRTASGTSDTTLKSWVEPTLLNPGAYYMWANSNNGFATLMRADTSSTQTIANDNGVALRFGGENSGEIIDSVGWGNASNIFVETSPYATNPGANQSLERINNQDSNNNALDFRLTPTAFPTTCGNTIVEGSEQCDDGNTINGDGCSSLCQIEISSVCGNGILEADEGCDDGNTNNNDGCSSNCQLETLQNAEIYINEFVPDPVSGSNEWVELYSPSMASFSVTNWSLEDGAGTKTRLTGSIGGNNKFLVIEKPSGSLNNSGDILILRNQLGKIINQVTYGDWDDGTTTDNAPTTTDPNSIARKQDGITSTNDSFDFAVTTTPTKGGTNTITTPVTEEVEDTISSDIVISEVFPNPIGVDGSATNGEFIELYNQGDTVVNLGGWHIEVGTKEYIYELTPEISIAGKSYILLSNSYYKLPNSGSSVKLFQPGKTTSYQTVTYKEAYEGESWILLQEQHKTANKIWQWTKMPTPKTTNILVSGPKAHFDIIGNLSVNQSLTFDSSDSETSGVTTTVSWNFGDGKASSDPYPQHTFTKAGSYTVSLTVKNEYGSSTLAKKIKIMTASESTTVSAASLDTEMGELSPDAQSIRLNEILPNPSGKDEGQEWIELFNSSDNPVSLNGWRIATHNKKGKLIESEIVIKPQSFFLLPKEFIPTLGNSNETIQLLASNEHIIDSVSYTTAPDNQSYAFMNNTWNWTTKLTPGEKNIVVDTKGVVTMDSESDGKNSITGTVVSLPGIFSTQYFHLKPDNSETLLQIYNSKKLFPKLELNQKIIVRGEMSTIAAGERLKTTEAADITIGTERNQIEIHLSVSSEVTQPPHPRLAKVEGEVTSKKSPRLIITDAQGDTEIYFVKGSNLSITRFNVGDKLTITGILELSGTTVRLMPRNEQDIIFHNAPQSAETNTNAENINSDLVANTRNPKKQLFTYLILGAVILISGGSYALWKYYGKK